MWQNRGMSAQEKQAICVVVLGPALDVRGGVSSVENLILTHVPAGVQTRHIPTMRDGSALRKAVVFFFALFRFIWTLAAWRTDLVHIHFSSRASTWRKLILTTIARLFRKPYILHAHGGEFCKFYARQYRPLRWCILWMLRGCRRLIVLSEAWRKSYLSIVQLPPERIVVLANPVELPASVPNRSRRSTTTLLFLGRMGNNKGSARVVQAVAALPETVRGRVHLVLAGDGDVEDVRRQVRECGLEGQATVLDWVNPEQRDTLLANADLLVLPSLHEGLPMSVLEAMSWGLPVVASPVGGIPEVVQDGFNGVLVPPTDIAAIAQALHELIENEPLRLQLGANARTSVEHLHITCYWERLRQVYESVLSECKQ